MQLLYFAPVQLGSYEQRPHAMVRYFLESGGHKVLWVNPYPNRLPNWQDLKRTPALHAQGTRLPEGVETLDVPALPIEPLPFGSTFNRSILWRRALQKISGFAAQEETILGIGRPSRLALLTLDRFRFHSTFFDAMDNFPNFYRGLSKIAMKWTEARIADTVNRIYVSSSFLEKKFAPTGKTVRLLNGYPMEKLPPCPHPVESQRKVFGFIGSIGRWFDWQFVRHLARLEPEAEIRLIGPCFAPAPFELPPNIKMLPPCRQEEAIEHLQEFHVGMIPFKVDALTAGVDPIKFYEYRGMGLPVLCTPFGEMNFRRSLKGVFVVEEGSTLKSSAEAALNYRESAEAVAAFRSGHNWSSHFTAVHLFENIGLAGTPGAGQRSHNAIDSAPSSVDIN